MAHDVCVIEADTKTFAVQCDGSTVVGGLSVNGATDVAALLARCFAGDQEACDELDQRGIEPPVLEVDATPLPCWEIVDVGYDDPDDVDVRDEQEMDAREAAAEARREAAQGELTASQLRRTQL